MSEPIKAEVWMRCEGVDQMHRVGTITYEKMDLQNGAVTLDGYTESLADFIAQMNEILAQCQEDTDG